MYPNKVHVQLISLTHVHKYILCVALYLRLVLDGHDVTWRSADEYAMSRQRHEATVVWTLKPETTLTYSTISVLTQHKQQHRFEKLYNISPNVI